MQTKTTNVSMSVLRTVIVAPRDLQDMVEMLAAKVSQKMFWMFGPNNINVECLTQK